MTPSFRRKASFLGTFILIHMASSISILFMLLVMGSKKLLQNWADEPGAIDIVDGRTRNYVTWDQDVLDRVKVLQRNKNKYQQEINSGVPFI